MPRSTGRAIRWTIIPRGSTSPVPSAANRPCARPIRWTPSSTAPGINSAIAPQTPKPTPKNMPHSYGLRPPQSTGARDHAVLPLLSARFSTRGMKATKHVAIDEPFASVFTQGIVIHETYRSENGDWLTPAEVRIEGEGAGRKAFSIATGRPVEIGPVEKMSKSRNNVVDPDD